MAFQNSDPREFARCTIRGNDGRQVLSIPVEGGARQLRSPRQGFDPHLSEHGRWRQVHLGAIEAAYGKTPFFSHLMPLIAKVYNGQSRTLGEFNRAIERVVLEFITNGKTSGIPEFKKEDLGFNEEKIGVVAERGKEILKTLDAELSILDAAMKRGPETFIAIIGAAFEIGETDA